MRCVDGLLTSGGTRGHTAERIETVQTLRSSTTVGTVEARCTGKAGIFMLPWFVLLALFNYYPDVRRIRSLRQGLRNK
jgi:hypothetical protein